jgi:hypothetical protein
MTYFFHGENNVVLSGKREHHSCRHLDSNPHFLNRVKKGQDLSFGGKNIATGRSGNPLEDQVSPGICTKYQMVIIDGVRGCILQNPEIGSLLLQSFTAIHEG